MAWTRSDVQRSLPCNPEVLVHLRERRQWTQRELATVAGYSERLISKAEAGKPISRESISDLAEALTTPEEPVYPEDLISDPLSLARAYIVAEYEQQEKTFDTIKHFLDEEIVLTLQGDPATIPFAGEHRGIVAVEQAFAIFFSIIEAPQNHDPLPWYTFVGQGNEVVIWGQSWLHPKGHPLEKPMPLVHRMLFRRGKLCHIEVVFDSLEGARILKRANFPHPVSFSTNGS